MPYYQCGSCQLTVYGGAGHSNARHCPNCGADLGAAARVLVSGAGRDELHRHIVREPQAAEAARRALETLLGELDQAELDVTTLLTTELVANSVKHGGPDAGGLLALDVSITDTVVRVGVSDRGPGFVPTGPKHKDPTDGHWGLQLVDELADRWQVNTDRGTAVWFELDRHQGPAPESDARHS